MYRIAESVRSTHSQDGAVVMDVRQGQMFNLNLVRARILALLKSESTESAVIDEISREFDVSREIAEHDVKEFIGTLRERRLLVDLKTNGHDGIGTK
jgi:hypothetical protein